MSFYGLRLHLKTEKPSLKIFSNIQLSKEEILKGTPIQNKIFAKYVYTVMKYYDAKFWFYKKKRWEMERKFVFDVKRESVDYYNDTQTSHRGV